MTQGASTSRLLMDEHPLQVLPSLAVAIGLNEAIIVQQMHYWLKTSKHEHDGRRWIYNTLEQWQQQFPFFSVSTLRRTIDALRKRGVLLTGNYNDSGSNRTLWYSIDYGVLNTINPSADFDMPFVQNEQMEVSNMNMPFVQNEQMLNGNRDYNRDYTETNDGDVRASDESPPPSVRHALIDWFGCSTRQIKTIMAAWNDTLTMGHLEQARAWCEMSDKDRPIAYCVRILEAGKLPHARTCVPKKLINGLDPDDPANWTNPDGSYNPTKYDALHPVHSSMFHGGHR